MNRDIAMLREVVVKVTQMIAGMGIQVTQRGMQAFVRYDKKSGKPVQVNIPNLPDNASDALLMAVQGFIDHECGHILHTNFDAQKAAHAKGPEIGNLWNIIEDVYIEACQRRKFPGAAYNLDRMYKFFLEHMTLPLLKAKGGTEMGDLAALLVPMCRAWGGQKAFVEFMDSGWWSRVNWLLSEIPESLKDEIAHIRDSWHSKEIAEKLDKIIRKARAPEPPASAPSTSKSEDKKPGKSEKPEDDEVGEGAASKSSKPKKEKGEKPKSEKEGDDEEAGAEDPSDEGDEAPSDEGDEEDGAGEPGDEGDESGAGDEEPGEEDEAPASGDDADDGSEDGAGEEPAEPGDDEEAGDEGVSSGGDEGEGEEEGEGEGEGDERSESDDAGTPGFTPMDDRGPSWFEEMQEEGHELKDFDEGMSSAITDEATESVTSGEYLTYSRDFDRIEPLDISRYATDPAFANWLAKLDDDTRHMVGTMQKDVERMMAARSQVINVGGYRKGRLHAAALHRVVAGDDRVFRRRHENRSKDVAVGLLIDNSGSMGGSKMDLAMTSGFALSQTLERVGIQHEVLGFTTFSAYGGRAMPAGFDQRMVQAEEHRIGRHFDRFEPLHMPIYKGFDERLTPEIRGRFAVARGRQHFLMENVDGECVAVAAQRLFVRKEKRKVLIVLSDGMPACMSHSSKLNSHLKATVEKATKMGVETFGIGIMSDAVKRFYPHFVVIQDAADLPKTVMGKLKEFLSH
jgi:cobalamin biosynthesis protein CobT